MADVGEVPTAVRLGWYLAEVRGRNWWRGYLPSSTRLPTDEGRPLPLRPERTAQESRLQAQTTLASLAIVLQVAAPDPDAGAPATPYPERLAALTERLAAEVAKTAAEPADVAAAAAARDATWGEFTGLVHEWDSCIQNALGSRSDIVACAYLLGRGLAESYWALGPPDLQTVDGRADEPTSNAWLFLLGEDRRDELTRLVGRVAPFVNPLTPAAIAGSLEAWGAVAADVGWRQAPHGPAFLYEQLRRWYELLVLGQDPSTLVKPYAMLRNWKTSWRVVQAFRVQVLLAFVGLAAVVGLLLLLATGRGTALLQSALGVVGALGLTAATVTTHLKSTAQTLLTRLRQDAYCDLVAVAVTAVPVPPDRNGGASWHRRLRNLARRRAAEETVRQAVSNRRLSVSTPQPDTPTT